MFIGADKGNRKGIDHFAKVISWFNEEEDHVASYCHDIDGSFSTSEGAADAIKHSIRTKLEDVIEFLSGQTTDSGGGGVLESLHKELLKVGVANPSRYVVIACTLHALQLAFANAMKGVYGEGALGKRNLLQLVHSCYDLQECLPGKEFQDLWKISNPNDEYVPNRMSAPVLTRWWYVNTACQHLLENWDGWKRFAIACRNATTTKSRMGKITRGVLSRMNEPKFLVDLKFINAFSKAFFVNHFEWLQGHDEVAKDFGYLSRHMAVRSYIIKRDLLNLADGWKTHDDFAEFRQAAADLDAAYAITESQEAKEDESDAEEKAEEEEEERRGGGGGGRLKPRPCRRNK